MKILIEVFRGCISAVKAPVPAQVTILSRDNISEPCSVSMFSPIQASDAEIDKLIRLALDEIDETAKIRKEQEEAQRVKIRVERWNNASAQFARMLSELRHIGLKSSQMLQLVASMNLTREELQQLLDLTEKTHSNTVKELGSELPDVDGG